MSHFCEKAKELIQQAREQGRCEAKEEMEHFLAQWYKDADQLMMQLSTIMDNIQRLQLTISEQFPGIGQGRQNSGKHPLKMFTQGALQPFERQASMTRQSSEESCKNISMEETAGRRMARESSRTPPISPDSCKSDDSSSMACAILESTPAEKEIQSGIFASSEEEQLSGAGVEKVYVGKQSDKKMRLKRM